MKNRNARQSSDRIATLGSRMMKFAPNWSSAYLLGDLPYSVINSGRLTVGDIRDAGASLVSQADGPEDVIKLVSAMSPSERKSFVKAFNSVDVPKRKRKAGR